jgi:hypothetical protein
MPSDYAAIREDNRREYGIGIGRWGREVLANRYDNRAHFILELLQNAEDALARRSGWHGKRSVNFALSRDALRVAHFGNSFDERDVRGICGIAESTKDKDLTAIGRFGIGFKSVYAFTPRPEIYSGDENFAIEDFVLPTAISPIDRPGGETIFVLPLRSEDASGRDEIGEGLQGLGPRTLLFLRQIEEIGWNVEGGPSGLYLRGPLEQIDDNVRRISLIGEERGKPCIEENWLVFSREARTRMGRLVGHVEIAFLAKKNEETGSWSIQSVEESPLFVFFPTVLPTGLGFLVQGPYRTTPSRDNVPANEPWNQRLVRDTAKLMVQALRWLRDNGHLDVGILQCLPLDRTKYPEGSRFAPLFTTVRTALIQEPLLPRFGGGYVPAGKARLARTQELRELFDPTQLGSLLGAEQDLAWLSGDITPDRTPELRRYIMYELDVAEFAPETILPKLEKAFLEAQTDTWVLKLYEFLNGQPALLRQARRQNIPLIRLEDGTHVCPLLNGQPQAFLPSQIKTDFPTVRRSVCITDEARQFLIALGLTEPDPVDDVVRNVLPKYQRPGIPKSRYRRAEIGVVDRDYEMDIHRIVTAFGTDSKAQRDKLVAALRDSNFVMAVGSGSKWLSKPANLYLATERLKELFAGISNVFLVDDSYACLRGEEVRELLQACGASRYLQRIEMEPSFTSQERREMRRQAGCESSSRGETIRDYALVGFYELMLALQSGDREVVSGKAALLWEALGDVERGTFSGSYHWFYVNPQSCEFDAAFVRSLNECEWVPDGKGGTQRPEFVLFESLGWKTNPFLLSKIRFKPPIIETLAKEAGFEPGVLELLKRLRVTSEAELRKLLRVKDDAKPDVGDAVKKLLGDVPAPSPPVPDPAGPEPTGIGGGESTRSRSGNGGGSGSRGDARPGPAGSPRAAGSTGSRPFISYVGAHPENDEPDPDGLDQGARMALEENAIALILNREPHLHRTATHNPGYDLFEAGEDGQPVAWIEVKAMTGDLGSRPVGLSHVQFECARQHGEAYWLYVVEHVGSDGAARIVRINDPAGKAKTFTFDKGWLDVAELDGSVDAAAEQDDIGA